MNEFHSELKHIDAMMFCSQPVLFTIIMPSVIRLHPSPSDVETLSTSLVIVCAHYHRLWWQRIFEGQAECRVCRLPVPSA